MLVEEIQLLTESTEFSPNNTLLEFMHHNRLYPSDDCHVNRFTGNMLHANNFKDGLSQINVFIVLINNSVLAHIRVPRVVYIDDCYYCAPKHYASFGVAHAGITPCCCIQHTPKWITQFFSLTFYHPLYYITSQHM